MHKVESLTFQTVGCSLKKELNVNCRNSVPIRANGHIFVVASLYFLSAVGRLVSGVTVAYTGLCLFCLYVLAENSELNSSCMPRFLKRRDPTVLVQDNNM
ncbi:hypothetical protein C3L33_02143, partial [Rhododendron williamsianum]